MRNKKRRDLPPEIHPRAACEIAFLDEDLPPSEYRRAVKRIVRKYASVVSEPSIVRVHSWGLGGMIEEAVLEN